MICFIVICFLIIIGVIFYAKIHSIIIKVAIISTYVSIQDNAINSVQYSVIQLYYMITTINVRIDNWF